jgi:hypothetical protein
MFKVELHKTAYKSLDETFHGLLNQRSCREYALPTALAHFFTLSSKFPVPELSQRLKESLIVFRQKHRVRQLVFVDVNNRSSYRVDPEMKLFQLGETVRKVSVQMVINVQGKKETFGTPFFVKNEVEKLTNMEANFRSFNCQRSIVLLKPFARKASKKRM